MTRDKRLRRSELSTPGSSLKMMKKASESAADLVFLDLEDSVAPNAKKQARQQIVQALNEFEWGKKTRAIRINNLRTPWAYKDVIEIVSAAWQNLDVIIVPKVLTENDVWWVDTLLTELEQDLGITKRIGLEVLIEDTEAMIHVDQIARSSNRLEALIFGPGDYSASQGVKLKTIGGSSVGYPGDIWHYARNRIIIAARAAGLDMVDGPFADFHNPQEYKEQCQQSRILGAIGKWAIHPSQIELANEVFSPSVDEVEHARKVVNAYAVAEKEGLGAIAIDGTMVDAASVKILQNTLELANLIGM